MGENILCIIGARGGSQGVPGKNVMSMLGKPLIAWTIDRAHAVPDLTHIVVSTDDQKIADVARQYGAEVPFMRPAELATSGAGKFAVWKHALAACEEHFSVTYNIVVDMDCTNPLLEKDDVIGILNSFKKERDDKGIDGMFTVCPSHRSPYFNLVEADDDGILHLSKKPDVAVLGRQAARKSWDIVAGIYVLASDYVRRANGLMDGRMMGYDVPREKFYDIDEPFDVKLVEFLLKERGFG